MILGKIKELIVERTGTSADALRPETSLISDIEADSLDAVEIIMAIENEFGIEIPDEEAEKFVTIKDIVNYLENVL